MDVDTLTLFPRDISIPKVDLDDFLRQAATDIITILTTPPITTTTPSLEAGYPTCNALQNIAEALNRAEILPNPPIPSPTVEKPSNVHTSAPIVTSIYNATLPRVKAHSLSNKPKLILQLNPHPSSILKISGKGNVTYHSKTLQIARTSSTYLQDTNGHAYLR